MSTPLRAAAVALLALVPYPSAASQGPGTATLDHRLEGMSFRNIGPFRGGRVCAVTGVRGQPMTFYFGGTGGGVWKTSDGGASWAPVSDKDFKTGSVGAVAVAESDPNVVYAGMGEAAIRGNLSNGDGVYRSTDAGKSWTSVGLRSTYQISRVRVHPKDPDLVYVAAQGHAFGPNADRGIFRSRDGGKTWTRVLHVDERTGASDLSMDPSNPRILYAGFWEVVRKPWALLSGGKGGGVWRSTDGGDTWKKLSGGLPEGVVGKIGVAASGARPGRVWAIVEAEKGGVFRSDDYGEKWTKVNGENKLRQRAWYYSGIQADPKAPDTVFILNVQLFKSVDGGKSFNPIRVPHGDNHDLWLDPDDPDRMIEGNDGGANVSFNGGRTWSTVYNQPTGQFYRVITDDRFPYRIYGAQQDNTTVAIPSASQNGPIDVTDWHPVGGCESGWVAPSPKDPEVVYAGCYGGSITRYDHRTGQEREITAWPQLAIGQAPRDLRYRFQWNAPILVSKNDPKVLYHAAQLLLRSTDEGQSWVEASPDLTRNDRTKQDYSGGPITRDNTSVETYDTIFAIAESPRSPGLLWVGTDDGLVHLTRDGGKSWANVTPKGMPEWIQVNSIDASPHDAATAYVAATMYKLDDQEPYLYRTSDYGKSWTRITNGIPDGAFTRVVREDPVRRGLLYCGTETGLYVSFDDGAAWRPFQRNLPVVPITDLAVKGTDLVVATQGRAFWILDDVSPLRAWNDSIASEEVRLFAPSPTVRFPLPGARDEGEAPLYGGKNPPGGAIVYYWLKEKPKEKEVVTLELLAGDKVLRTFTSEKKDEEKDGERERDRDEEKPIEPKAGLNRFVWDLRMLKPTLLPKAVIWGVRSGPLVAPGTYTVRLKATGKTLTESLEVRPNPNLSVSTGDLRKQYDLLAELRDRLSETHATVMKLRDVKAQATAVGERAEALGKGDALKTRAKALSDKLTALEEKLVNPKLKSSQDVLNFTPKLDHAIVGLASAVSSADAPPTEGELKYWADLRGRLSSVLADCAAALEKDVADFNAAVEGAAVPPVAPNPMPLKQ